MDEIREIFGALHRDEITDAQAQERFADIGEEALAEFMVDAFNRGWISNFNLGLDDDGNTI